MQEEPSAIRPQVLMLEGNFTFVQDWATAAGQVADVTLGVGIDIRFSDRRPGLSSGNRVTAPVVNIPRLHLRPSRVFAGVSAAHQAYAIDRAIQRIGKGAPSPICIHTHFYSNADGAILLKRRRGIPFVHTEHSSAIVDGQVSASGRRRLFEVCREAAAVFAVSQPLADAMRDYGVDVDIRVAHNPVDLGLFASSPLEARFPIEGPVRLATVGWLLPRKDHESLLRAFAELRQHIPGSTLDIVGAGPMLDPLRSLACSLDVTDRVSFHTTANRSEVARILSESHLYVHTSRAETFGVALVEAWASGMPVVTFDCGGISALAPEIGGQAVVERSIPALVDAIVEEVELLSPERSREIRVQAQQRFDSAELVKELDVVYRRACS